MEIEIQAGAKIDVATPAEVADILRSWQRELMTGVDFKIASSQAVAGAGTWALVDPDRLAPQPGMLWSITNIAAGGGGFVQGVDAFSVFAGEASTVTIIGSGYTRQASWPLGAVVVKPGSGISLTGVSTGATTDIGITVMYAELPMEMRGRIL
jgi:hypothetical protein